MIFAETLRYPAIFETRISTTDLLRILVDCLMGRAIVSPLPGYAIAS